MCSCHLGWIVLVCEIWQRLVKMARTLHSNICTFIIYNIWQDMQVRRSKWKLCDIFDPRLPDWLIDDTLTDETSGIIVISRTIFVLTYMTRRYRRQIVQHIVLRGLDVLNVQFDLVSLSCRWYTWCIVDNWCWQCLYIPFISLFFAQAIFLYIFFMFYHNTRGSMVCRLDRHNQ